MRYFPIEPAHFTSTASTVIADIVDKVVIVAALIALVVGIFGS